VLKTYTLQAALEFDGLSSPLHLGLSAVLEETNGRKSYWALAHPPGKADFHHSRLLYARIFLNRSNHEIWHRTAYCRTCFAGAAQRRRVALLAHPASVTADLTHSLDALAASGDIKLAAAFGPQHGLRGDKQDNMVESQNFNDPVHGIPVFSLYGEVRKPTDAMIETCDVILVDLQDLGCRIYTLSRRCAICSKRQRSTAKRCGCWIGPIPSAGRSKA